MTDSNVETSTASQPSSGPTVHINPPPADGHCQVCGRHVTKCYQERLWKTFRGSECISASWECKTCLGINDEHIRKIQSGRYALIQIKNSDEQVVSLDTIEQGLEDLFRFIIAGFEDFEAEWKEADESRDTKTSTD